MDSLTMWYVLQNLLLMILVLLLSLYAYFKHSYSYWKSKAVPSLEPTLIFGNFLPVLLKQVGACEFSAIAHKAIKKLNNKFGGYYIFDVPIFVPIDPQLIKCILVKDFDHFQDRGFYTNENADPLLTNLVTLRGTNWKRIRSKVNPAFTSQKIKLIFENLLACSKELDNILEQPSRTGSSVDIRDIMARLTTDNIATSIFGIDCNSLKNPAEEFRKYGQLLMNTTFKNHIKMSFAVLKPKVLKFFNVSMFNRKAQHFFLDVIKQTINYREENQIHRKDFMDFFIQMKNNSSSDNETEGSLIFQELAAIALEFNVGGFKTTEATMTFGLLELALNPHIQDKLRKEILEVEKKYGEISYDGIKEMVYLDKVVCEILRKYPPISILQRECNRRYHVPDSDVVLDKGTRCWISTLGLHMDPELYPDPEKFDPERFTEEEKAQRQPCTYLPFGEGPRICIGKRMGLLQVKVAYVKMLKKFKFFVDPKTILPIGFTVKGSFLGPKNKIWLHVEKINEETN